MDFAELVARIEEHLKGGGKLVLERVGQTYTACSAPLGTYAIIGQDGGSAPTFNQGAVGTGQLLWLMEQQAGTGNLSEWRAVEGG